MPLSRLRLRLTGAFAVVFALGLAALAAGVLGYLWHEASGRLDSRLAAVAHQIADGLDRELTPSPEAPHPTVAEAASEVVREWPTNGDQFAILDDTGAIIVAARNTPARELVDAVRARASTSLHTAVTNGDDDMREVTLPHVVHVEGHGDARVSIMAFGTTEGIEQDVQHLGGALAPAALLIVLISVAGGYVLARRALGPVNELRAAISAIAPTDLSQRLPSAEPHDEIGALAAEFNGLLGRLNEAQLRNRGFVREAAHQIRTPLTLVLGEAGHELGASSADEQRTRAVLTRVRTAAEQIQRRVDELFLLAEAQSGESVRLDDHVEVDDLVLECTDLMRGRASALGRSLAIGRAEPVVVRGNAMLLKEALLELIENGCKHGDASAPVTVSAYATPAAVMLSVESAGEPFTLPAVDKSSAPEGLGLPIVRWIAREHGGELSLERVDGRNVLVIGMGREV